MSIIIIRKPVGIDFFFNRLKLFQYLDYNLGRYLKHLCYFNNVAISTGV